MTQYSRRHVSNYTKSKKLWQLLFMSCWTSVRRFKFRSMTRQESWYQSRSPAYGNDSVATAWPACFRSSSGKFFPSISITKKLLSSMCKSSSSAIQLLLSTKHRWETLVLVVLEPCVDAFHSVSNHHARLICNISCCQKRLMIQGNLIAKD